MAETIVELLTDVADAIREKKGTTEPINAQSFAEEIRTIETDSPFAVDFGEEIATMNPYTLTSLQEDIDYYNEVQRKRAAGEVTDAQLLKNNEFRNRIAWIPKGMTFTDARDLHNLKVLDMPDVDLFVSTEASPVIRCYSLEYLRCGIDSRYTRGGSGVFENNRTIKYIEILRHSLSSLQALVAFNKVIKSFIIDSHNVANFSQTFRDAKIPEIRLDLFSATDVSNMFLNTECTQVYLKNLGISLTCKYSAITNESIKFILDNCQEKEEPYTLTLHATAKNNFLAKCDEDAEYAASLAAANAKGLTLA